MVLDPHHRLTSERDRLIRQLADMGATEQGDLRQDVDFDEGFADAAAATAERTEMIGLVESLKRMVDEIDAALARVEEGAYGTCVVCGREIGAARLEHRPESIHCVECKSAKAG